ncbi:MAG: M48 family metallopeptidase [Candidatus Spyradosoma sp.]
MPESGTNFFERQDRARRATRRLVVWFALAVLGTAGTIYAIAAFVRAQAGAPFWEPELFAWIFGGTLVFVGGASLFKSLEMGGAGGAEIAKALGGVPVPPTADAPRDRRLVNVVQEMSVASGVPMPRVFVLERESGINAFAAGTRVDDAAIAVSRGALEKLSRDELQAVVGHEFSHVLNGDMRLNVKLCGWIFGLVALSILGRVLTRGAFFAGGGRSRKNDGLPIMLIGLAVMLAGAIGQFFASLIQAAISRHRERLADASATQFTRNPLALARALSRIGGDTSRLVSPRAGEYAHFFFADGVGALFATHPPLEERIRALDPAWDGKFLPPLRGSAAAETEAAPRDARVSGIASGALFSEPAWRLRELVKSADGARAAVFMALMTDSPGHNREQAELLLRSESKKVFALAEKHWDDVAALPPEKRISLVVLAAPSLRAFTLGQRREFCATLRRLAEIDGEVSLFEFLILRAVEGVLFPPERETFSRERALRAAGVVFAAMMRENAFPADEAARHLREILAEEKTFAALADAGLPARAPDMGELDAALDALRPAPILFRESLMRVCARVAERDGVVSPRERDLLDALSLALACPLYARVSL